MIGETVLVSFITYSSQICDDRNGVLVARSLICCLQMLIQKVCIQELDTVVEWRFVSKRNFSRRVSLEDIVGSVVLAGLEELSAWSPRQVRP